VKSLFSVHVSDEAKVLSGHDGPFEGAGRNTADRVWLAGNMRVHIQTTLSAPPGKRSVHSRRSHQLRHHVASARDNDGAG
jgi:hypothetical protein